MKRVFVFVFVIVAFVQPSVAQIVWPEVKQEAKPYTRWWWLGSAVDEAGLRYNLSEYQKAGIGGVEITPIYGVQGNEDNEISYLSPRWMQMLRVTEDLGRELGIEIDMATGTGWPFGGPNVPQSEAACKLEGSSTANSQQPTTRTGQKVKRAAPGGEGLVIDHFDRDAVKHYLEGFDRAFGESGVGYPHTFFNDSYEVYGADWTPKFLDEFRKRRGYDLQNYWDEFMDPTPQLPKSPNHQLLISDYRETLGELLLENFTTQWTDWAHAHGAITRNQAHGSPANLIDIYAAVDIPECEGFGLSDFGIKGLRTDPGHTKKNDSDLSMLKYASSAAHISGKNLVSSETFTWLTEHFRTSLSQCKPDFDLMMVAGVNHVFFHGSCYSPQDAEWPGWRFYASVDMSPNNNWWSAMPAFSKYIERVQSWMQYGEPDNDVLVYLPYYDMIYEQPGRLLQFDIHSMAQKAPRFIESINNIIHGGWDCDYISDKYLQLAKSPTPQITKSPTPQLTISQRSYSAIVIPNVRFMPLETLEKLVELAKHGARIVVQGDMPKAVPGLGRKHQQKAFDRLVKQLSKYVTTDFGCQPEEMRTTLGLSVIRRSNDIGHHYFISNLQAVDVDGWVKLAKPAKEAYIFNPMNGKITRASMDAEARVRIQLLSGESLVLLAIPETPKTPETPENPSIPENPVFPENPSIPDTIDLRQWQLSFPKAAPEPIAETFTLDTLKSWTKLGNQNLCETMATGLYQTEFEWLIANSQQPRAILDLGDVRETALVRINGEEVATLFAVPYRVDITDFIRPGKNTLEVEVCNLPANRIAKMDRDGVAWRRFKEINVVNLHYGKETYENWTPVPSGLCSPVRILCF